MRGQYHQLKGTIVKVTSQGEERAKENKGEKEEDQGGAEKDKKGEKEKTGEKEEEVVMTFKGHWDKEVLFEDLREDKVFFLPFPTPPLSSTYFYYKYTYIFHTILVSKYLFFRSFLLMDEIFP